MFVGVFVVWCGVVWCGVRVCLGRADKAMTYGRHCGIDIWSCAEPMARQVPDNGGVFFVPAFSGLFAPYWRQDARGVLVGLSQYSTKSHFARAVYEATCFQVVDVINAMQGDSGVPLQRLKVDGGMTASDLLLQTQADLLNLPVVRASNPESTALGAAIAAGLAVRFWTDLAHVTACVDAAPSTFGPQMTTPLRQVRCGMGGEVSQLEWWWGSVL